METREEQIKEAIESGWFAYTPDEYNEQDRMNRTYKFLGSLCDLLIRKNLLTL